MQVLFVGVFLLTKASAPKGQGSTGNEHLTVELNKAKIAYVHHEDDEVDLPNAEAAETTGLIGTKVAKENLAQSEKLQGGHCTIQFIYMSRPAILGNAVLC